MLRYKRNYDRTVRLKNKELQVGSWVFIRKEVHEAEVNPKLCEQVNGLYCVLETDGQTILLQLGEEKARVSSDRVTPAPTPCSEDDLTSPREDSSGGIANDSSASEAENVFEWIVGGAKGEGRITPLLQGHAVRYPCATINAVRRELLQHLVNLIPVDEPDAAETVTWTVSAFIQVQHK
jgi:hypothetical protein